MGTRLTAAPANNPAVVARALFPICSPTLLAFLLKASLFRPWWTKVEAAEASPGCCCLARSSLTVSRGEPGVLAKLSPNTTLEDAVETELEELAVRLRTGRAVIGFQVLPERSEGETPVRKTIWWSSSVMANT